MLTNHKHSQRPVLTECMRLLLVQGRTHLVGLLIVMHVLRLFMSCVIGLKLSFTHQGMMDMHWTSLSSGRRHCCRHGFDGGANVMQDAGQWQATGC